MNDVLHEANERIKFPLRKLFINLLSPSVSDATVHTVCGRRSTLHLANH